MFPIWQLSWVISHFFTYWSSTFRLIGQLLVRLVFNLLPREEELRLLMDLDTLLQTMLARFGRWTSSFKRVSFLLSFDCQSTQIERLNHSGGLFTSRLRSDNFGGARFLRRNCQVRRLLKIRHVLPDRSTGALWPVILV